MRLYRDKNRLSGVKGICFLVGACLLLGLFWLGFQSIAQNTSSEQLRMTEESIRKAAVNCYAIEGSYPQNISYLTEHYGIRVDEDKYSVNYSIIGGNTLPFIEVVPKGGRTELDATSWTE